MSKNIEIIPENRLTLLLEDNQLKLVKEKSFKGDSNENKDLKIRFKNRN